MMMESEALFLSVFPEKNENESEVENESERESESESKSNGSQNDSESQSDSVSKGKDSEESDSEDYEHQLDEGLKVPSTFLKLTNQNFHRVFGASEGVCDSIGDDGKRKIIIR
jgi:hypothetical protein